VGHWGKMREGYVRARSLRRILFGEWIEGVGEDDRESLLLLLDANTAVANVEGDVVDLQGRCPEYVQSSTGRSFT
jgi:hypothetical protein